MADSMVCPRCSRHVAAYVPADGNGSLRLRRHRRPVEGGGSGEVCEVSSTERFCENTGRPYATRYGCGCEVCEP